MLMNSFSLKSLSYYIYALSMTMPLIFFSCLSYILFVTFNCKTSNVYVVTIRYLLVITTLCYPLN